MRFAYVGLGRAARLYHYPSLPRVPGATAVGGTDDVPETRAAWQNQTGMPVFDTVEELLEQARPDVVVVATPPSTHASYCIASLEAGAHVICEKPFVETAAQGDAILAAAERAGRQVAVNHQFRAKPIFKVARDKIESGDYGRLTVCQMWQLMNEAPWQEPTPWRAAMAQKTLLEGGCHLVDLMIVLFGAHPEAVYARHSSGFHDDPEADAVQAVTLEFPGNRLGIITINRLCNGGTRYFELRADCERGSLRSSMGGRAAVQVGRVRGEATGVRLDYGPTGLAWVERGLKRTLLARSPRNIDLTATGDLTVQAVEAFRSGVEPASSGRQGRDVIAVIEAAYESAEKGERILLHDRLLSTSPEIAVPS